MDQIQIVSTKLMSFDTPCQSMTFQKRETVIIGDTKFDLIGGQTVGIKPWPSLGDLEILKIYFSTHQILFVTLT